jgi:hypothetical protein
MCTPDTLASVPQSRHLPSPYQYAHVTVNAVGGSVNHRDPVKTSHLPDGEPESVAKARTAARGRAPDSREIP